MLLKLLSKFNGVVARKPPRDVVLTNQKVTIRILPDLWAQRIGKRSLEQQEADQAGPKDLSVHWSHVQKDDSRRLGIPEDRQAMPMDSLTTIIEGDHR